MPISMKSKFHRNNNSARAAMLLFASFVKKIGAVWEASCRVSRHLRHQLEG
ncbi:hypothetical protein [Neorhizobium sp. NCHU2750]|uniref:hypothetical protein n=1 Tax=Neorhizobium sp. NCHU2750 TaxID=1825976 RepID=UPI0013C43DDA